MGRGFIRTRKTAGGKNRYAAVIKIHGKQRGKTFIHRKAAEDYLDNLSGEVRDGSYREIRKATFREYLDTWKEINLNDRILKPATIPGYASIIEKHLIPSFGGIPLLAISADEIGLFKSELLRQGTAGKTVNNILNLLGKILADAKKSHYLKYNPILEVDKAPSTREQKGRALKPDEIGSLLDSCSGLDYVIIATAIATGMRRGEQFGLDWEHVDFENNVIQVCRALFWKWGKYHEQKDGTPKYVFVTPKSEKSIRDIDMSPELRKELLALYLKSGKKGLVFGNPNGTPMHPDNFVKRNFAVALKHADEKRVKNHRPAIGKVRWHDLRHTFGSLKIDQGEDLLYVSRQMGHSSIQVTADIYAHQIRAKRPDAAAKTDAVIFRKK
jgi:integrase